MAGRGSGEIDPDIVSDLTQPLENIEQPVEKLRQYHRQLGEVIGRLESDAGPVDRITRHIRRHLPLYALGSIWALMIVLIPTVNNSGESIGNIAGGTTADGGTDFSGDAGSIAAGGSGGGSSGVGGGGSTNAAGTGGTSIGGQVIEQTGVTRGGFECKPGVRQIPWSAYAAPCIPRQAGNPGATFRGVTDKTIKITVRKTSDEGGPNGQVVDEANKNAGRATAAEAVEILGKYVDYFNNVYELHGRKVQLVPWSSTSSVGTEEAQSKGREAAKTDAKAIVANEKSFGDIAWSSSFIESEPFAEAAAAEKLFVPSGAAYFPEIYFKRWHPYVWGTVMECERISKDVAEYVGKRLAGKNAKWAENAAYKNTKRVFGVYVPDNDGYQHCVDLYDSLAKKGGFETESRFNYALDVSRFPDQAAAAVVQFQADGVTTLINACDTISTQLMSEASVTQGWGPEWLLIGVAGQDTEGAARGFNQDKVDGHMFGMSQLGSDARIFGKDGEAYQTWKTMFPKQEPPRGFGTIYYGAVHMFNLLQAGGANLTPQSIAAGIRAMPAGGGAKGAVGTWYFGDDHTAIDDSREIYWVGNQTAYDGNAGAFIETYGGKRFKTGEWPAEPPPIYPKK